MGLEPTITGATIPCAYQFRYYHNKQRCHPILLNELSLISKTSVSKTEETGAEPVARDFLVDNFKHVLL